MIGGLRDHKPQTTHEPVAVGDEGVTLILNLRAIEKLIQGDKEEMQLNEQEKEHGEPNLLRELETKLVGLCLQLQYHTAADELRVACLIYKPSFGLWLTSEVLYALTCSHGQIHASRLRDALRERAQTR